MEHKAKELNVLRHKIQELNRQIEIISLEPFMAPMRDITQISGDDRLFYELGYKLDPEKGYGDNWILKNTFEEILDVNFMLENDKLLSNIEYLKHHNFMILKK